MKIELKEISVKDVIKEYKNDDEEGVVGYAGKLNIRPKYQREFVYKDKQRDAVIETIRKSFPLNVMYWVKNKDGTFEVMDGQQRTISFCEYIDGKFSLNFQYFHNLEEDEKEQILIEKIDGKLVKDILEKKKYNRLSEEIGKKVAVLHNNLIIHGDLTTSNMIYSKEIYFIDFGLSFFSEKAEDKAVDLHLLKEALESKHYKICEEAFKIVLESYKKEAKKSAETLKRLEKVEKRGRYRAKKRS